MKVIDLGGGVVGGYTPAGRPQAQYSRNPTYAMSIEEAREIASQELAAHRSAAEEIVEWIAAADAELEARREHQLKLNPPAFSIGLGHRTIDELPDAEPKSVQQVLDWNPAGLDGSVEVHYDGTGMLALLGPLGLSDTRTFVIPT